MKEEACAMTLLLSDDERSTLQAALAFVDAHFDAQTPSRETSQRRQKKSIAAEQARLKRRSELLQLREQHQELQAKLDALRARGVAKKTCDSVEGGSQLEEARLREALAVNKNLHATVEQYGGVVAQVVQLLTRRNDLKCLQGLLLEAGLSLDACRDEALGNDRYNVFDFLKDRLRACVVDATAAVVSACKETSLSGARTRVYPHPLHGSVVEAASSVLVPCSKDHVWLFVTDLVRGSLPATHKREYDYKFQTRFSVEQDAYEKEYSLAFKDTERREQVPVDGLSLIGFAQTPHGMIYAWSSVVSIPGE